jgi:hypothetical protein
LWLGEKQDLVLARRHKGTKGTVWINDGQALYRVFAVIGVYLRSSAVGSGFWRFPDAEKALLAADPRRWTQIRAKTALLSAFAAW